MRKFFTFLLSLVLAVSSLSLFACEDNASLSLYAPDGAPALSVARLLIDKDAVKGVEVNIVSASTISSFVTGEELKADIAILPVNVASKMLGGAKNYQMLGVVTNGNLFLMKKGTGDTITTSNLSTLIGKKVGVINLSNVPGLTFKAILSDNDVPFTTLTDNGVVDSEKVNLVGLSDGTAVTPASACEYFVVPEPAATTKQNATGGKLTIVGSLQQMYGGGNGYPQAVIVAKNSVIEKHGKKITELIDSFSENVLWLTSETTKTETIVSAVTSGFVDSEMAPTFNANNLNQTVIGNCGINFRSALDSKADVLAYIQKLNAISNNAWGTPSDEFFYLAK